MKTTNKIPPPEVEILPERTFVTARQISQSFFVNGVKYEFTEGEITTGNPDVIAHLVSNGVSEINVVVKQGTIHTI